MNSVLAKRKSQLAFYMGLRDQNVVLQCLFCISGGRECNCAESLDSFYWMIVMELVSVLDETR